MNLGRMGLLLLAMGFSVAFSPDDSFKRERDGKKDQEKNSLEGGSAPQLMGDWFNTRGKALDWESLKGKVVVLDFWTHWCGPCRTAVPHVRKLLSKHGDKGLFFIAIHSDPNKAKMEQAIRQLGITWPVLLDAKKTNLKLYAADSFPDYYLVDRKGVLRYADLANEELEKAVEMLLAEEP
jgi:thiol-disulfide isomerase/thioredoxin